MTLFEAFLFGAVQGLTEYLPVSSSAHLILLPRFLGTQDPGLSFDVFLHAGTLASTLIYFRRDWAMVWNDALLFLKLKKRAPAAASQEGERTSLFLLICLGTLPALLAGALLHEQAETVFRGNPVLMTTLVLGGVLLWSVDQWRAKRLTPSRSLREFTVKDALWIGLAQCLALVPGMSRSGSTMIGGRALGFDRASAAKFSFLLSAPITAAALVFELRKFQALLAESVSAQVLLVGGVSAFVFGMLAIGGLLRLLRHFGYLSFALYRVLLAIAIYRVLGG